VGWGGKLTLIAAPAGFGKTTLLIQGLEAWGLRLVESRELQISSLQSQASRVAWLSLDPTDNDPTTFLRYLIAALQVIVPDIGATALALLRSPQLPPIDTLMTALLNDASALPQAALLVLDDYHVITTPAIHQALAFLLDHLPHSCTSSSLRVRIRRCRWPGCAPGANWPSCARPTCASRPTRRLVSSPTR
jgi:LuxR family maltose regulon positive regulatory protein